MTITTPTVELQSAFQFDDPGPRIEQIRDAVLSLDSAIHDLSKALAELDDRDVAEAVREIAHRMHHDTEDLQWEFDRHDFPGQVAEMKELAEQSTGNDHRLVEQAAG